jgi:hypothetical protein
MNKIVEELRRVRTPTPGGVLAYVNPELLTRAANEIVTESAMADELAEALRRLLTGNTVANRARADTALAYYREARK